MGRIPREYVYVEGCIGVYVKLNHHYLHHRARCWLPICVHTYTDTQASSLLTLSKDEQCILKPSSGLIYSTVLVCIYVVGYYNSVCMQVFYFFIGNNKSISDISSMIFQSAALLYADIYTKAIYCSYRWHFPDISPIFTLWHKMCIKRRIVKSNI